ncbi:ATP-binding protein [Streptomyces polyrhachis]|uniref:ATP-binding protein n=1 Tax=Streptomyces polyrhachis TaxID=1282885 RepID=A0ABW2GEF5_9ACTN
MQQLQVQLVVRPDPVEVGRARRWARARLAWVGVEADDPSAETLILLISELVTNAVVHTGRPAELHMALPPPGGAAGILRVEVVDGSVRAPQLRQAASDATHGRGLELVGALADRWGWEVESGGKRIWCEVDRTPVRREVPGPAAALPAAAAAAAAVRAGFCEHARAVPQGG